MLGYLRESLEVLRLKETITGIIGKLEILTAREAIIPRDGSHHQTDHPKSGTPNQ